jgi:predicted porin
MKKSLLALAVLGAFAGVASAQSSVTVYGIVDEAVGHIDNGGKSVNALVSGTNASSRIGFKGVEDLGNGLKTSFVLEQGFNADDGTSATSTQSFSRLAYVGLGGGFGEVRLGKQNTQIKTALSQIDPFETSGLVNAISFFGATSGLPATVPGNPIPERVQNQLTYTSNVYGGFSGSIGYTFGEQAGDSSAGRSYGAQLGYVNGPLNVQFGYNDQDQSTASPANVEQSTTKIAFLGATYDFGVVKLHAAYGEKKYDLVTGSDIKVKAGLIGATVPFGASKVRAEYIRNDDNRDGRDNNVIALSYSYSLSKRTTLYTTYARVNNDNLSAVGFGTTNGATAIVADQNTSAFVVGVQHNF